jgi:hypothetical protein
MVGLTAMEGRPLGRIKGLGRLSVLQHAPYRLVSDLVLLYTMHIKKCTIVHAPSLLYAISRLAATSLSLITRPRKGVSSLEDSLPLVGLSRPFCFRPEPCTAHLPPLRLRYRQ